MGWALWQRERLCFSPLHRVEDNYFLIYLVSCLVVNLLAAVRWTVNSMIQGLASHMLRAEFKYWAERQETDRSSIALQSGESLHSTSQGTPGSPSDESQVLHSLWYVVILSKEKCSKARTDWPFWELDMQTIVPYYDISEFIPLSLAFAFKSYYYGVINFKAIVRMLPAFYSSPHLAL